MIRYDLDQIQKLKDETTNQNSIRFVDELTAPQENTGTLRFNISSHISGKFSKTEFFSHFTFQYNYLLQICYPEFNKKN